MKIGIDARTLHRSSGGVGTYLKNLLEHLSTLDQENQYVLFFDENLPQNLDFVDRSSAKFSTRTLRLPIGQNLTTWNNLRLPVELWLHPVDLFHFPFYTMPLIKNGKSVVSMHDISYKVHPEWFNWKGWLTFRPFSYWAAKIADRILTCSYASKEDILRCYKLPEQKVIVTYYGVSEHFYPISNRAEYPHILNKYNVQTQGSPLLLYVGSITLRKNLVRLIQAFRRLVTEKKTEARLLIVGRTLEPYPDLPSFVKAYDLENKISFLSESVSEDTLRALYNRADLFVYPSLYEGFGLPPLEAMACGTPVVTSNISSLPEVTGDAAILVNPYNIGELAEALFEGLTNGRLRKALIERGLERIKKFSWRKMAQETLQVYQST
jgi:glycosyltransferase involved in cell wall biosynthesis